jgi:hypothetical protein
MTCCSAAVFSLTRDDTVSASMSAGDDIRGATDFGPRGGKATAQRPLADADTTRPRAESDTIHIRCRGAKSFVDDLGQSRGVVLSRAVNFCDLLRLSFRC